MHTVLITPRSLTTHGHAELDRLKQAGYHLIFSDPTRLPDEDQLIDLLDTCAGYVAGVEPITRRVLESARHLKVISRYGSGTDNIDFEAAERCGIQVCSARGANARSVAELTLGFLFALTRSIVLANRDMKSGHWQRHANYELAGKLLGIIGYGHVGQEVHQLAESMGMRTLIHDPAAGHDEFDRLIKTADIITLHCPPGTSPLLTAEVLSRTKPGVYIINAARGELIDDTAMLAALNSGHVAGLAVDAWRTEPPGKDPLALHPQVIATPHMGGHTLESMDRTAKRTIDQLLEGLVPD